MNKDGVKAEKTGGLASIQRTTSKSYSRRRSLHSPGIWFQLSSSILTGKRKYIWKLESTDILFCNWHLQLVTWEGKERVVQTKDTYGDADSLAGTK